MGARLPLHVYYATAAGWTDDALLQDVALLQPGERERASRFHFEADRRMYVGAHALLRRALSKHAPVPPSAWRLTDREGERPEIALPKASPRLRFCLSHTRAMAACAVVSEFDVGLDIEQVSRVAPLEVAERFAPIERAALDLLGPAERSERFFVYWTLKEAYAKASGRGLAISLDEVAFDLSSPEMKVSFVSGRSDDEGRWRFATQRIEHDHRLAVAVRTDMEVEQVVTRL
jgi:4'-phosphopantetheinyl transferase